MPKTCESTFYTLPRGAECFGIPHLFVKKSPLYLKMGLYIIILPFTNVMLSVKRNIFEILRFTQNDKLCHIRYAFEKRAIVKSICRSFGFVRG